jgi:molybdopterin/thiamine biosynthesis adenylyltransferase
MISPQVSDELASNGPEQALTGRFARHALIPGWQQGVLASASVAVIGVGALGNEVARLLAMSGVGELLLCDPDRVSESNLSRCVLFRGSDVGRLKVVTARQALAELAPGTQVRTRAVPLDAGIGLADLRDLTLVVSCLDSIAARVLLAQRCAMVSTGWLDGGTQPWGGEVRRFCPDGACYGCLAGAAGRAMLDNPVGCGALLPPAEAGASAPVSALVGAWLATMAVRMICGLAPGPEAIVLDAAAVWIEPLTLRRSSDCPLHAAIPAELIRQVPLTNAAVVSDALALVAPDEDIMTWRGFAVEDGPGARASAPFVDGGRTVTFLRRAAHGAALRDLGVAPREILPVVHRATAQLRFYVELTAEEPVPEEKPR